MLIYKITNIETNKIYIGKTSKDLRTRWKTHINASLNLKNDTRLYNSIRKYGKENFKIEQIDEANTLKELQEKEFYWINYFNSTSEKIGYNIQKGNECGCCVVNDDTKIKLVLAYKKNKRTGNFKRNSSNTKSYYVGVYFNKFKKLWEYSISFKVKT